MIFKVQGPEVIHTAQIRCGYNVFNYALSFKYTIKSIFSFFNILSIEQNRIVVMVVGLATQTFYEFDCFMVTREEEQDGCRR